MKKIIVFAAIALAVAACIYLVNTTSYIKIEKTEIDRTANVITEIRRLGQWEFLTVRCETMVDPVRSRTLMPDDRLARIYTGAMRLGVDLDKAPDTWIKTQGDSIADITLPAIGLLDDRFIDEAATVAFYESGRWDAAAKEEMYRTARRRMLAFGLSKPNIETARQAARSRFTALFSALGFKHVNVTFTE